MKEEKKTVRTALAAVLVALSASLCCITPVLALISGVSGMAAGFSWLEPLRPYMAFVTFAVLGVAWYGKLRPKKADVACACEEDQPGKEPFLQSKKFLAIVTVFALAMLAFPYYAHIFYPEQQTTELSTSPDIQQVNLKITGMTCTGCAEHIQYEVKKVPGVAEASASYEEGKATVKYDARLTTPKDIIAAINSTGYKAQMDMNIANH